MGTMTGLITLKSDEGQKLLADVKSGDGIFQPLLYKLFKKQIGNKNCGVQSAAMLLGAQDLGLNGGGDTKYNEMALLEMEATKNIVTSSSIDEFDGMVLKDVGDLLKAHGKSSAFYHAADQSVDSFRQLAVDVLSQQNSSKGVIVNYHMATLGQSPPFGHHSPLGGYHRATDRFLLLDVWKDTEECWATTDDLYKAMNTEDSETKKSRGFIILQ